MTRFLSALGATLFLLTLGVEAGVADDPPKDKPPARSREPVKLTDEARAIHREALLIDGHNDLPYRFREKKDLEFLRLDITRRQKDLHTDIPKLREGGVGGQFWSAYVSAERAKDHTAVRETIEQIDVIHRMVRAHPDVFAMAATADDVVRIHAQGKIASMIGVEGGHSIDNSLGVLRVYYTLGVRYMTLTHSENTDWADSATDKPVHHGLTPFGEQVVREMNRLGMLVDISHVSAETMRQAIRVSKAPVIASHSSAFAVAAHPRNVPDDVLLLIKEKDGVVMVNFYPGFVVPEAARIMHDSFEAARQIREKYPKEEEYRAAVQEWYRAHPIPNGDIHDVVDHIDHIVKVAGVEHVGIGSDFDGINKVPKQLEDVSCYPYITQELLNRGYSKEDIFKILGGNVLRVLRKTEQVARDGTQTGAAPPIFPPPPGGGGVGGGGM